MNKTIVNTCLYKYLQRDIILNESDYCITVCSYLAPFLRHNSEILVENGRFEPTPPLFGAPLG